MVKGVFGRQAFSPSCGQKRRIPADKSQGETQKGEDPSISQSHRHMNGIISFQGMLTCQSRSGKKILTGYSYQIIAPMNIIHKLIKDPVPHLSSNSPGPI